MWQCVFGVECVNYYYYSWNRILKTRFHNFNRNHIFKKHEISVQVAMCDNNYSKKKWTKYIVKKKWRGDIRHPKGEEMNEARPKGLKHIFGDVWVIHAAVLVPVKRCNTMCPFVSHSAKPQHVNAISTNISIWIIIYLVITILCYIYACNGIRLCVWFWQIGFFLLLISNHI